MKRETGSFDHHFVTNYTGVFTEETHFYFSDTGQIFVLTGFGNFAHYFGSMGSDMKRFLLGLDKYYFTGKMESSYAATHKKRMPKRLVKRMQDIFEAFKTDLSIS